MRAIVLVAGRGSRLKGLTDDRPKCLVSFCGEPLLGRILRTLAAAGCTRVSLVGGYRVQTLHEFVARGFGPVEILVNERWEETNMVQSLLAARRHLEVEPCLVSYGDIFYAPETVQALAACDEDLAVAYDRDGRALWEERFDDPLADIESFRLAPDGSLAQIGGAVRDIGAVEGQYMGPLKIQPEGFAAFLATLETLPEARRQRVDMTSILTTMIGLGHRIGCVENGAPWGELDSPEDIAFFEKRGGWPAAQHAKVS